MTNERSFRTFGCRPTRDENGRITKSQSSCVGKSSTIMRWSQSQSISIKRPVRNAVSRTVRKSDVIPSLLIFDTVRCFSEFCRVHSTKDAKTQNSTIETKWNEMESRFELKWQELDAKEGIRMPRLSKRSKTPKKRRLANRCRVCGEEIKHCTANDTYLDCHAGLVRVPQLLSYKRRVV